MTLDTRAAATGESVGAYRPIVVAVDGSERNRSAVDWAAHQAAEAGCKLVLVTAVEDELIPTPHFSVRGGDQQVLDMLTDVRSDVRHVVSEQSVEIAAVAGSPVEVILERSGDARMTVVGKRGLGAFARVLVGSTSIALAGRSKVPVAIIPDAWKQADHSDDPVVVGIDSYRPDHNPIHLAFSLARRLGVKLVAVHGWVTPATHTWDATMAGAAAQWEKDAHKEFDKVLDIWRERFPDVEVEAVHMHSHPAMAVLDAAEHAQLVVLGRHTDGRLGGFAFGSVTRAVLHYSECPVMVVPTEGR
jgi:nucleotide-binding universal stress UspA family protein